MSRLFEWFYNDLGKGPSESELQELRNIVLEEAGFQWIPIIRQVSKDPEINKEVLITVVSPGGLLYTDKTFYSNKGWTERQGQKLIAWMPKPKPYEPSHE